MRSNVCHQGRNLFRSQSRAKISSLAPHSITPHLTPIPLRTKGHMMGSNPSALKETEHAPFASVQASKPLWDREATSTLTTSPNPVWKYGSGISRTSFSPSPSVPPKHVEIDPFAPGRPMAANYTLLISGVTPRPIGFVSTLSSDGTPNLAPFSYFQVVDHDPPVFVLGFSGRAARPKDTLRNLQETGECTINMVSESMIEAVNASSVDAPYGVSEWKLAGLTMAPSSTVKPARVQESVFSVEGRLTEVVEFKTANKATRAKGCLAIVEGVRFWVREDAVDAEGRDVNLDVLRPVAQLGGMMYGRIGDTFELPRVKWDEEMQLAGEEIQSLIGGTCEESHV